VDFVQVICIEEIAERGLVVRELHGKPYAPLFAELELAGGCAVLKQQNTKISSTKRHGRGFSLVELVIVTTIVLILSAIAMPSMRRTLRGYQMNDAANQVAGIVKFTRFEAIRRNSPVTCVNTQNGANGPATIWSDDNGDNVAQSTEKQILLSSSTNLQPAGAVPNTGGLAAAVGAGALTAINPTNGNITFDQRGAVVPPGLYVFYVGNSATANDGYRAVIILPSGSVQVWTYNGGGTWVQLS
jgi:type IV fimbrial biogenesis protein FimT